MADEFDDFQRRVKSSTIQQGDFRALVVLIAGTVGPFPLAMNYNSALPFGLMLLTGPYLLWFGLNARRAGRHPDPFGNPYLVELEKRERLEMSVTSNSLSIHAVGAWQYIGFGAMHIGIGVMTLFISLGR